MNLGAALAGRWHVLRARHQAPFRACAPGYTVSPARWLVLSSGPNPSLDYYIRPRAQASGLPWQLRDIGRDAPRVQDLMPGTHVVVVRYLNPAWARALHAQRAQLAGVTYFMDDDLLDPAAWRGLPAAYERKLARHFNAVARDIAALSSGYWVSTPALQARYPTLQAAVTPPLPLAEDRPRRSPVQGWVQIFYHGTEAHLAEMRWLHPIVAEVLAACPQAHFEIIGSQTVYRLYRNLPRTRVLHPLSWPNYLAHCRRLQGHIGLAPLLDSSFNAGRSSTKLMDNARCGATGLYSDRAPYAGAVTAGHGLLLPDEPRRWVQALRERCEALLAPVQDEPA